MFDTGQASGAAAHALVGPAACSGAESAHASLRLGAWLARPGWPQRQAHALLPLAAARSFSLPPCPHPLLHPSTATALCTLCPAGCARAGVQGPGPGPPARLLLRLQGGLGRAAQPEVVVNFPRGPPCLQGHTQGGAGRPEGSSQPGSSAHCTPAPSTPSPSTSIPVSPPPAGRQALPAGRLARAPAHPRDAALRALRHPLPALLPRPPAGAWPRPLAPPHAPTLGTRTPPTRARTR